MANTELGACFTLPMWIRTGTSEVSFQLIVGQQLGGVYVGAYPILQAGVIQRAAERLSRLRVARYVSVCQRKIVIVAQIS